MSHYGLFDIQDNLWLGAGDCPFSLKKDEAEFAKKVLCERLNWPMTRIKLLPLEKTTKKRDEVTCEKTLEEAIDNIQLREMSNATGISVERLRKIESGRTIQTQEEDNRIREYLGIKGG